MDQLIIKAQEFAIKHMNQYDPSHNYQHVHRVYALARLLEQSERDTHPEKVINSSIVALASLLHDVGDKKYLQPGEDGTKQVEALLLSFGADEALAQVVQLIVNTVSYSSEIQNPDRVQKVLAAHPELAIVQDADRLDAIGAIGIGRTFTFNAAREADSMNVPMDHLEEKLLLIHKYMKTRKGQEMAVVRTERMKVFHEWWKEEVAYGGGQQ